MKKLNIGVIGAGKLGGIHLKLWNQNPDVHFVGFFDPSVERAKVVADEFNVRSFSTLEELISQCDAVTIASPTIYHFEIASKCIEKGLHCLIEKPITGVYEEAIELIKLAENKKALIQVGHVERFNPALTAIKSHKIEPLFIEAHRLSQFQPRATDVSVIHDLMIHDIDIALWLVKSKVKHIDANGVAVLTDTPDIANARISFENGAVVNLTASRITARPMRKMRVFQKNAYLSIDFAKQDVEVYSIKDKDSDSNNFEQAVMLGAIESGATNRHIMFAKPTVTPINAIEEEQKAFVRAIQDDANIPVTGIEAAEALRIADEINRLVLENMVK
jgi:predicted dehydrogenase